MNFEHSAQIDNEFDEFLNSVTVTEVALGNTSNATSSVTGGSAPQPPRAYKRGPYKKARAKHTSLRSATGMSFEQSELGASAPVEPAPAALLVSDGVADAPPIRGDDGVSRTWVLTLNNYTEDDIKMFDSLMVKKMVISKEVGESGTPHLQGAITWLRGYRLSQLKKIHRRVSWRAAKAVDCFNYCMKEGSVIIINKDNGTQGKRNDLLELVNSIKEKRTLVDAIEDHPDTYIKYHNGVEKFRRLIKEKEMNKREKPYVEWIWGTTGIGKSYYIEQKEPDIWWSGEDLK